tara:strand:- start:176 stop:316 length:141 start_codon:yes stop_codon:yes gene_type:complete
LSIDLVIFILCLCGCGLHSWHLGKQQGIEGAVQYFIDQGYIEVEDE